MEKNYVDIIKNFILLILSLFFTGLFFAQTFDLVKLFSPDLGFLFFGLPTNFLIIVTILVVSWGLWVGVFPIYLPKVIVKIYPNHSKIKKEEIQDDISKKVAKNSILLFFTILFSGLTYNSFSATPIGNDFWDRGMSWFLCWFIFMHACILFISLILKIKTLNKERDKND
jgi:hypothetical protein